VTFILNLLHKNYSLLASDREANIVGRPGSLTKIQIGDITISSDTGITLDGFRKVKLSRGGACAVGIVGTVDDHHYFANFEENEEIDSTLNCISESVQRFCLLSNRAMLLSSARYMINEGIVSFFDSKVGEFFSLLYKFTRMEMWEKWYYVPKDGGPMLIPAGSGSSKFEEAVGKLEIEKFVSEIADNNSNSRQAFDWIRDAYNKVSRVADGVGGEPEFCLSTRLAPLFCFTDKSDP